jgi:hypothetical protein
MRLFLSWSGPRSKLVAEALDGWVRQVIQAVDPWISSEIEKGARWQGEIASHLEEARIGIICLTRDNLTAPWILFEAGALSKIRDAYVCTFLLDVSPSDVEQPLGQFQHTSAAKDDVRRLMHTINSAVRDAGERSLQAHALDEVFETFWPKLEEKLGRVATTKTESAPVRTDRELLEELLELARAQEQRVRLAETTQKVTMHLSDASPRRVRAIGQAGYTSIDPQSPFKAAFEEGARLSREQGIAELEAVLLQNLKARRERDDETG